MSDGIPPASRQSNYFVDNPIHLDIYEKIDLRDNLRKWVKVEYPKLYHITQPWDINITPKEREAYFEAIFNGWSRAADPGELPSSPTRKDKDDTRILVGKWDQDLPKSSNKRKREEEEEDDDDDDNESPRREGSALRSTSILYGRILDWKGDAQIIVTDDDDDVPRDIPIIDAITQTQHFNTHQPLTNVYSETELSSDELMIYMDLARLMHQVEKGLGRIFQLADWRDF
ncbi:hypothetical protein IL306_002706 [Fusarium sp. DS 682]|nr:hypothetical protein IL306_002706 [Fusarium sp. DS 682]